MPRVRNSLYRGQRTFDREQLIFVVECSLVGALDRIDSGLPDCITADDRRSYVGDTTDGSPITWLTDYENGALESAGMALAVLYAQLNDDGLGVHDALVCAGGFYEACIRLVSRAWRNDGKAIVERCAQLQQSGVSTTRRAVYGDDYPNTRRHAETFVDKVFQDYLADVST